MFLKKSLSPTKLGLFYLNPSLMMKSFSCVDIFSQSLLLDSFFTNGTKYGGVFSSIFLGDEFSP